MLGHLVGMKTSVDVIVAQSIGLAVGVLAGALAGGFAAVAAGVAVMIVALVPLDGRTAPRHAVEALDYFVRQRFARTDTEQRTVLELDLDGTPVGVVWNGSTVSIVAELHSAAGWTTIRDDELVADTTIPLRAIFDCLARRTGTPFEVSVCTQGNRPEPGRRASETYVAMAGPLAAVAARRTWMTLSVDVHLGSAEAARRGGGLTGSVDLLAVQMSRLRHVLRAASVESTVLSRDEIDAADLAVTQEVPRRHCAQRWGTATVGGSSWTSRSLDPRRWTDSTLDDVFRSDARSTGFTVGFRSGGTGDVAAAAAFYDVDAKHARVTVPGSASLAGRQLAAVGALVPSSARPPWPTQSIDLTALDRLSIPVSGSGQIVGVDDQGAAVSCRLHGPGVQSIRVAGELFVVHQIVFRAVATGARVLVLTDRHHAWRHLADAVSDSGALTVAATGTTPTHSWSATVIVVDDGVDRPTPTDVTLVRVGSGGSSTSGRAVDVIIEQVDWFGDRVTLTVGRRTTSVRLVTTSAETDAIGRPRSPLRPPVHERG
ncbi:MAG: type VII secretion protein EccE [Rhodococcus sp. (in: high G+C Gram-positive bacteria)]